jgi:hypothetical protein
VILSSRVNSGADSESAGKKASESRHTTIAAIVPRANAVKTFNLSISAFFSFLVAKVVIIR